MPFRARYPGRCRDCGELIDRGEPVVLADGMAIVHEDCTAIVYDLEPAPVCPRCRLLYPCECEAPSG